MRVKRFTWLAAFAVCVAIGGWLVVSNNTARSAAPPPPNPDIPITAGAAQAQDVPIYLQGIGTVQAINTVNVKSRVDGEIMQAFFTQGQEVQQNDRLFLIDPRPFQALLDQAKANAVKDQAQLLGAQRDLTRFGQLVGSGFQTRQSFEDQQATVAQLQGALQADQAAIETQQLDLGFTAIRSPISGRTGALLVDPGNYVQASTGTPLVSITQVKPIFVDFTLPATNLDAIRQSQADHPLQVDAFASDGKTLLGKGTLSFIDNHVDITTGTIALKGTFANADERLWPGEFINARLILSVRHNAVTVPAQTVMAGPNGDYVYVIRPDDTVQRRTVQLASQQDGIAVIAKGLAAGDKVVVDGQYRLANNVKVKIEASTPVATTPVATTEQPG
jgi:membrane fusion protein, multidrug efflux system